jgi:sterol desaturase/sphingolipid hydroxylase (fatty acid hydroxylase superfamily)
VIVSSSDVLGGTCEGEQTGDVSVLDKVFIVVVVVVVVVFIMVFLLFLLYYYYHYFFINY